MRRVPSLAVLVLLVCGLLLAENPQPLSLLVEKNYPVQGIVGISTGTYFGDGQDELSLLPNFYVGLKPLGDCRLFDTPVEFDLGRSIQFSLRNIGGSPWSAGTGINYDGTTVRLRKAGCADAPGFDLYSAGPYAYVRFQATEQMGIELAERADYIILTGGNSACRPSDYWETETRFLVDYDARKMDPRPEVLDHGLYAGLYGFARQRPDDLRAGVSPDTMQNMPTDTYGLGGLGEYLWQPWISGNFGPVVKGELTFNADMVWLGRTELDRGQGHVRPYFLVNQNLWIGSALKLEIGEDFVVAPFGQSDRAMNYFRSAVTLGQALSPNLMISITYEYDENPFKPTRTGRDQTAPHYIGASTSWRF